MKYNYIFILCVICFVSIIQIINCNVHGGTLLALAGLDSVVLAIDTRFSTHQSGPFLIGQFDRYVFKVGKECIVGCFGLDSDSLALLEYIKGETKNHYNKDLKPENIARLISNYLYDNQAMCTPIVLGLCNNKPYLCAMDGLGAETITDDYAVVGTASSSLYSICESLFKSNLNSNQLVTIAETAMKLSMQRDVLSGCKVKIYTLNKEGIFLKEIYTDDV